MINHNVAKALEPLGMAQGLRHEQTLTSAVTTGWGVNWDEEYIARDIMQNFFDANRGQLDEVKVGVDGSDVTISAPALYDLEHLFYFHSTKGEDDIGQYGEGFKAAATCLLRDHHIEPIAVSKDRALHIRISDDTVGNIRLKPIVYDFFQCARHRKGTQLILRGCTPKLIAAFKRGLSHFLYEENPLLGDKLWSSHDGMFALYQATQPSGCVFYRKLRRGEVPDIPVILVINKEYAVIEKKIKNDRDRNAFGEALMKTFYNTFARYGVKHSREGQRAIVEAAEACWMRGHPLLREVGDSCTSWRGPSWDEATAKEVFGDAYFARSSTRDTLRELEFSKIEREWTAVGRKALPQYFAGFGVITAARHYDEIKKKAEEEAKHRNQRHPTAAEANGIYVLTQVLRELVPEVMVVLGKRRVDYVVAKTDSLLGELREDRAWHSREVFLAEQVLVADFPQALAVFLHEHTHIFGRDGSREFTDALTELLETVVRNREHLDPGFPR